MIIEKMKQPMRIKLILKNPWFYIVGLIFLSFMQLVFALRTNSFFSVDDFAILAYFKTHTVLQMIPDFLIHGDIYFFRRLVGFIAFGGLFELFGTNHLAFDISMFLTNTANLIILFLIVKKLTSNDFAAFFVSVLFNKNYLFYYSNIHEHLLSLFCLLTIYFFIAYPKKFYLSVISLVLALFTKETAFTVPLVLLAISLFHKLDRKKIFILIGVSVLYGLYASYFFVTQKVLVPNFSYTIASKAGDLFQGILYFVDYKILLLFGILPLVTKKYKYVALMFAALITLIPASLLVNRREMYYLYMPFGYLMICLSMYLPKLNIKTSIVYVLVFLIFGGRSVLPRVAWQTFPNWQKVSMDNVLSKVENGISESPEKATISLNGIYLERDAELMLQSGTMDLFINKNVLDGYNFNYDRGLNTVTAIKK